MWDILLGEPSAACPDLGASGVEGASAFLESPSSLRTFVVEVCVLYEVEEVVGQVHVRVEHERCQWWQQEGGLCGAVEGHGPRVSGVRLQFHC